MSQYRVPGSEGVGSATPVEVEDSASTHERIEFTPAQVEEHRRSLYHEVVRKHAGYMRVYRESDTDLFTIEYRRRSWMQDRAEYRKFLKEIKSALDYYGIVLPEDFRALPSYDEMDEISKIKLPSARRGARRGDRGGRASGRSGAREAPNTA